MPKESFWVITPKRGYSHPIHNLAAMFKEALLDSISTIDSYDFEGKTCSIGVLCIRALISPNPINSGLIYGNLP